MGHRADFKSAFKSAFNAEPMAVERWEERARTLR
jgi:hypothetical protein